jgi:prepilin peptidase CpaA
MGHQLVLAAVLFLFCLAVIHGAITDMTTYTIPNWIPYGLVPLFAIYAALEWNRTPVLLHAGIGLLVFVICIVFWKLRWVGGGDVKFVAAISLWMGPDKILVFLILLSLGSAGFVSFLRVMRDWNPYFQGSKWPAVLKRMMQKAEEHAIPYGLPAAIAALAAMFSPGLGLSERFT